MDKRFDVIIKNNVVKYLDVIPNEICIIQEVITDPISEYRGYKIQFPNSENAIKEVYNINVTGIFLYDDTLKKLGFEYNTKDNSFQKDNCSVKRIHIKEGDLGFNVIENNGNLIYVDTIHSLQNYWELELGKPFDIQIILKALHIII